MKNQSTFYKYVMAGALVLATTITGYAQKLNDIQAGSVAAPSKVKVDGKLAEWDAFQAYNKATLLNYTISNDEKNLYLVVKSTDAANNTKIMMGGINFLINTADKKKDKDAYIVTYPLIERGANRDPRTDRTQRTDRMPGGGQFGQVQGLSQKQRDSLVAARGTQALSAVKEIKVIGFKDIPDSLISIYNEYGIKAVASFDAAGAYQYELAIPLNSLGLSAANPKEFTYNIKVNGRQIPGRDESGRGGFSGGGDRGGFGGGNGGGDGRQRSGNFGGGDSSTLMSLFTPTDFWGKYTLIKK